MMRKSIVEIEKELQAAKFHELPEFISTYQDDDRNGTIKLVNKAKNRIKKINEENLRLQHMSRYENQYQDYEYICGIDEVGRGPLAGPVVAAAVILPKDCKILYINDSKKLSEKKREDIYQEIVSKALAFEVGIASHLRIDEINILQATYEAMQEAVHKLKVRPDILLNDAVTIPKISIRQVPIIKGDEKSISIAAASIVAKVTRDRIMEDLDNRYPGYGFSSNKGYGSAMHIEAIKKLGPSKIHRRSFIGNFI